MPLGDSLRLRWLSGFIDCGFRNAKERLHRARKLFERWLAFNWFGLHGFMLTRIMGRRAARHQPKERQDRTCRLLQSFHPVFGKREMCLAIRACRYSRSRRHGSLFQDLVLLLVVQDLLQRPLVVVFYSIRKFGRLDHSIYRGAFAS